MASPGSEARGSDSPALPSGSSKKGTPTGKRDGSQHRGAVGGCASPVRVDSEKESSLEGRRLRPRDALASRQSSDETAPRKRKAASEALDPDDLKRRIEANDDYLSAKAFMTNMVTVEGQLAANPHLTHEEAKLEAKREYHRQHAAICRTRNRSLVSDLQQRVDDLTARVEDLEQANQVLQRENAALRAENQDLRALQLRHNLDLTSLERASTGLVGMHPFEATAALARSHQVNPGLSPAEAFLMSTQRPTPSSILSSAAPLVQPSAFASGSLGGVLNANNYRTLSPGGGYARGQYGGQQQPQQLDASRAYAELLRLLLSRDSSNTRTSNEQKDNGSI